MTLSVLWMVAYAVIVALMPDQPEWLIVLSLVYPVYYVVRQPVADRRAPGR